DSALQPDILITLGMGVVSKPLKQWLKANKPQKHIHISPLQAPVGDPFHTQPQHVQHHEVDALFALDQVLTATEIEGQYLQQWQDWMAQTLLSVGDGLPSRISELYQREFAVVKQLLSDCDARFVVQLGNSMSVRYASWSGSSQATLYANRGTSGIDGSLSTAVGFALANPEIHCVALLGDISAIYDAHALWTAQLPKNFTVVVLNNRGGQIFNWIGGPAAAENLMPLIETPHQYNLKHLCDFYQIDYARHTEDANTPWQSRFLNQARCTLWEV
ncbi:MAG: hypothetical protein FJX91_07010, partial [Bacteroidetes bacterium]|nr:hypothetical protein [Bacteroidota bacterium]